ncbi:MAG TPA: hypothetical protein VGI74_23145 [Streptosporangiaceae bacterium]|jgi:hypothetical protein
MRAAAISSSEAPFLAEILALSTGALLAGDTLFAGAPRLTVQTPVEAHMTKKRSGSSDGAQTYDTPIA